METLDTKSKFILEESKQRFLSVYDLKNQRIQLINAQIGEQFANFKREGRYGQRIGNISSKYVINEIASYLEKDTIFELLGNASKSMLFFLTDNLAMVRNSCEGQKDLETPLIISKPVSGIAGRLSS